MANIPFNTYRNHPLRERLSITKNLSTILLIPLLWQFNVQGHAQGIADGPAFSSHQGNYLTIDDRAEEVKFQFSMKYRLLDWAVPEAVDKRIDFPFNAYQEPSSRTKLYFTFTQKSFGDVAASSAPFKDSNTRPGLTFIRSSEKETSCSVSNTNQMEGTETLHGATTEPFSHTGPNYFMICPSSKPDFPHGISPGGAGITKTLRTS